VGHVLSSLGSTLEVYGGAVAESSDKNGAENLEVERSSRRGNNFAAFRRFNAARWAHWCATSAVRHAARITQLGGNDVRGLTGGRVRGTLVQRFGFLCRRYSYFEVAQASIV